MKIVEIHSHLNGLEYPLIQCKLLWQEIESAVQSIDVESMKIRAARVVGTSGQAEYDPLAVRQAFREHLCSRGWRDGGSVARAITEMPPDEQKRAIEAAGQEAIFSYNQTDFVKDRVALEVQFGKYAFVAFDLFVKHLAFYVSDKIDVGVEVLPMKSMQQQMSSGPGYYEAELYNVIRNGRGVPAVPLVLIGIEP